MWGAGERETNETLFNSKNELKAGITAESTNLNKVTVEMTCSKFQSSLEAVVEANGDIFMQF